MDISNWLGTYVKIMIDHKVTVQNAVIIEKVIHENYPHHSLCCNGKAYFYCGFQKEQKNLEFCEGLSYK